jgi:hypothetical protein
MARLKPCPYKRTPLSAVLPRINLPAARQDQWPACAICRLSAYNHLVMARAKEKTFELACPDCGAMIKVDASTGLVVSHTPAPRKRMFEDLETAAKAMREHDERKESIFRQSVDAEKNKADLLEKKFAEAMRKAKDAPEGKPLRDFDLD